MSPTIYEVRHDVEAALVDLLDTVSFPGADIDVDWGWNPGLGDEYVILGDIAPGDGDLGAHSAGEPVHHDTTWTQELIIMAGLPGQSPQEARQRISELAGAIERAINADATVAAAVAAAGAPGFWMHATGGPTVNYDEADMGSKSTTSMRIECNAYLEE